MISNGFLEDQEFYEAMQDYRHARLSDQAEVTARFEAVKMLVRTRLAVVEREREEAIVRARKAEWMLEDIARRTDAMLKQLMLDPGWKVRKGEVSTCSDAE